MAPCSSSEKQPIYRPHPHGRYPTDSNCLIQVTEIDDDDLQFGGKSLSEWYEEERRRLSLGSSSSDEEDRRGRPRVSTPLQLSSFHPATNTSTQGPKTTSDMDPGLAALLF